MKVKRIGVGSAARMTALLYAVIGLIVGGIIAVCSALGAAFTKMAGSEGSPGGAFGVFFGVGAVLIMPPLYAIVGGVMAAITVSLYNALAKVAGGLEVDLE